jgi:YebC/PmpR family DNA-binding regulatory protein
MGRAFEYRKATMFARWDRMAKAFTRAGREILIAVKQGGPNLESNLALRRAVQNAKSVQMPKASIESAIKRASAKDTADLKEISYEGMALHGVAIILETTTDNHTRTAANVRAAFNKKGGSLGTQGMHDFIFSKKGVFQIKAEHVSDQEELEFSLIDHGLDLLEKDIEDEQEYYLIYTHFSDFGKMQEALENLKIPVEKAHFERVPSVFREVSAQEAQEIYELIDKLEQDDDVSDVFHNMKIV